MIAGPSGSQAQAPGQIAVARPQAPPHHPAARGCYCPPESSMLAQPGWPGRQPTRAPPGRPPHPHPRATAATPPPTFTARCTRTHPDVQWEVPDHQRHALRHAAAAAAPLAGRHGVRRPPARAGRSPVTAKQCGTKCKAGACAACSACYAGRRQRHASCCWCACASKPCWGVCCVDRWPPSAVQPACVPPCKVSFNRTLAIRACSPSCPKVLCAHSAFFHASGLGLCGSKVKAKVVHDRCGTHAGLLDQPAYHYRCQRCHLIQAEHTCEAVNPKTCCMHGLLNKRHAAGAVLTAIILLHNVTAPVPHAAHPLRAPHTCMLAAARAVYCKT